MSFFSKLEYYNFLSLEINPTVEKFCEQPIKIEIIQENKKAFKKRIHKEDFELYDRCVLNALNMDIRYNNIWSYLQKITIKINSIWSYLQTIF